MCFLSTERKESAMSSVRCFIAAVALVSLGVLPVQAEAGEGSEPAAAVAPAADCCKTCVSYVAHRPCRKVCCCCTPAKETVLKVKDPCCCCRVVEVPICLPGCCEGCPCVHSRCGLLGRGVVTYTWCCGYKVRIIFRRCGDVVVHTYGS